MQKTGEPAEAMEPIGWLEQVVRYGDIHQLAEYYKAPPSKINFTRIFGLDYHGDFDLRKEFETYCNEVAKVRRIFEPIATEDSQLFGRIYTETLVILEMGGTVFAAANIGQLVNQCIDTIQAILYISTTRHLFNPNSFIEFCAGVLALTGASAWLNYHVSDWVFSRRIGKLEVNETKLAEGVAKLDALVDIGNRICDKIVAEERKEGEEQEKYRGFLTRTRRAFRENERDQAVIVITRNNAIAREFRAKLNCQSR